MSFLIPLIPVVTETATTIGVTATELTGSQAIGTAVTGGIISQVGQTLNEGLNTVVEGTTDYLFGEGSFEWFKDSIYEKYEDAKDLLFIDPTNEEQVNQYIKKNIKNNEDISKNVANFTNDLTVQLNKTQSLDNSTIANILNNLKKTNPVYFYLADKLMSKIGDFVIPKDEDYIKISQIYNGNGLFEQNVKERPIQGGAEFYSVDETDKEWVWKYPEYNSTYTPIPALYGIFVGISSPNNRLPLGSYLQKDIVPDGFTASPEDIQGELTWYQSYLCRIAFQHDIMYHDLGNFNKFADYVLIARIENGLTNNKFIYEGEKETAQVALNYFSTLGNVVRKIYGDTTSEGIIKNLYSDVYDVVLDNEQIEELKDITKIQLGTVVKNNDPIKEITNGAIKMQQTNFIDPRISELIDEIQNLQFEID